NVNDMWSLLLHTGYLTAVENPDGNDYKVKIPNLEIKKCFEESIQASFLDALTADNKNYDILKALSDGDSDQARKLISGLLISFISNRIYANKSRPENFYEGFMTGILSSFGNRLSELKVEHEAGLGFADIRFRDLGNQSAMVIELKVANNVKEAQKKATDGVEQIEQKGYAQEYIDEKGVPNVSAVGIAFFDKDCIVATKRLS
ncbi:MAG: PD-(D/E)XK nuclease domain-containing protein, partial [Succinatimonas hippei]|nr:PD-(D/E)XK nuclease domain-containing protein [Succinatimonas hippei]